MSPAVKLKKLIAGNMADSNSADGDIIVDQEGLTIDFTNNTLLETLHICNYPNLKENLNLSSAVNLKELDARNSGFTGVSIADGAPLQSMQL
jgi:hypothetical protein